MSSQQQNESSAAVLGSPLVRAGHSKLQQISTAERPRTEHEQKHRKQKRSEFNERHLSVSEDDSSRPNPPVPKKCKRSMNKVADDAAAAAAAAAAQSAADVASPAIADSTLTIEIAEKGVASSQCTQGAQSAQTSRELITDFMLASGEPVKCSEETTLTMKTFDDAGGDHDCNDTALLHAKCMMPVLADGGGGGSSTASTESTKDV